MTGTSGDAGESRWSAIGRPASRPSAGSSPTAWACRSPTPTARSRRGEGRSIRAIFESEEASPPSASTRPGSWPTSTARAAGGVIATGGGAVLLEANRRASATFGFVAWLTADPDTLAPASRSSRRGVCRPAGPDRRRDPGSRSPRSSRPGLPLYRRGRRRRGLDAWAGTPEQVAEAVVEAWSRRLAGADLGGGSDELSLADPRDLRRRPVRDRDGGRQLPERLHLPDPLGKERYLAGVALPELPARRSRPRDNLPVLGWLFLRGRLPELQDADLDPLPGGRAPGRAPVPGRLPGRRRPAPPSTSATTSTLFAKVIYHVVILVSLLVADHVHRRRSDDRAGLDHEPGDHSSAWRSARPSRRSGRALRTATTHLGGLWVGLLGLVVGGAMIGWIRVRGDARLPTGGDGLGRHPHFGDDRRVPGLAGRGGRAVFGGLRRPGPRRSGSSRDSSSAEADGPEEHRVGPRDAVRPLSQHRRPDPDDGLALGLGPRLEILLRHRFPCYSPSCSGGRIDDRRNRRGWISTRGPGHRRDFDGFPVQETQDARSSGTSGSTDAWWGSPWWSGSSSGSS